MRLIIVFLLSFFLLGQSPAFASYPLPGDFTMNNCEAYTSLRKKSEPVTLEPGKVYQAFGLNKESGDYISIKVGKQNKWVNKNCGQFNPTNPDHPKPSPTPKNQTAKEYVLAISWQPSFCQGNQYKKECKSQTEDRFDATNFTLHGLWPDRVEYLSLIHI